MFPGWLDDKAHPREVQAQCSMEGHPISSVRVGWEEVTLAGEVREGARGS